jgi:hypothetical protein
MAKVQLKPIILANTCEWSFDTEADDDLWNSSCGGSIAVPKHSNAIEIDFKYCPFCGKTIDVQA